LFFFVFLTYGADAGFAQAQTQPQNPLAEKTILILNAHESNIPAFVKTLIPDLTLHCGKHGAYFLDTAEMKNIKLG
jgi:hypothetical protein